MNSVISVNINYWTMNTSGLKPPEIKEHLLSYKGISVPRRRSINVPQHRGQTALGILHLPAASARTSLFPRRSSITASSGRRTSVNYGSANQLSPALDVRRVSYTDVNTRPFNVPRSAMLRKSSSESDAFQYVSYRAERRGSLQVKPGTVRLPTRYGSRRQSRVHSIPEYGRGFKVVLTRKYLIYVKLS